MKNSNDTIGNRTRDLPACSAVTQPTAPPRAHGLCVQAIILNLAVCVPSTRLSRVSEVTDALSPRQLALLIKMPLLVHACVLRTATSEFADFIGF